MSVTNRSNAVLDLHHMSCCNTEQKETATQTTSRIKKVLTSVWWTFSLCQIQILSPVYVQRSLCAVLFCLDKPLPSNHRASECISKGRRAKTTLLPEDGSIFPDQLVDSLSVFMMMALVKNCSFSGYNAISPNSSSFLCWAVSWIVTVEYQKMFSIMTWIENILLFSLHEIVKKRIQGFFDVLFTWYKFIRGARFEVFPSQN